ncbi:integrin beta-PS-like [Leptopilina heterotoma]|uniref:integrin beta-PS-like n=1 Tax=Leptopilina heterotoma TaxID=63436 RepID=UPI001CA8EF66|nr:integrin beta-PS-like [Leptopilina heterotoma]
MIIQFFIIFINLVIVFCGETSDDSFCAAQQNCTSCLRTTNCVWCSLTTIQPIVRCVTRERYKKEGELWCAKKSEVVDDYSKLKIIEDRPLLSNKGSEPVQVQPQKIRVRLRTGEEKRVTLKYSLAQDYPVDLYYLMDLSASMENKRDQLSELGFQLADAMRKLTSNFRLGFGSFVDKVALPMTNTQPERLVIPCNFISVSNSCTVPYGYRNQLFLTEDVSLFKTRVKQASISGNMDAPEGGLDAMLQAMVCTKDIGWRPKARHLMVFSTDDKYHIAGDGKLAGIVEPNDGLCHLDEDGYYTYSLLQDYPSIAQINKVAQENNINIIFAVPPDENITYYLLSKSIFGSSIGLLENDSTNVVALISNEYEKLVSSVTMSDNATKAVDIKYFSRCLEKSDDLKESRVCEGLRVGNVVEFEIILKALNCPENPDEWQQNIQIRPTGLDESLTIDLQIICDCPCDRDDHSNNIPESSSCKGNGTLICGTCYCNPGFYGKFCECKGNMHDNEPVKDDCSPNGEEKICSGRGTCKCGVCDCAKRANSREFFYGKYCECDNFSCKRNSAKLVCGGRGKCECGTCNCFPGWTGDTCDCKETNRTCKPTEETNEICSGHGDCVCGKCHCHQKGNIRYSGQFCEDCPTCPEKLCEEFKDCVECFVHNSGPLAAENGCESCPHHIAVVKELQDEATEKETGSQICKVPGDGDCTFAFKYKSHRESTGDDIKAYEITARKSKECPEPVNAMGVAIGVIITTVILGLLVLVVWKVLTEIHDKREFAKFENERTQEKWSQQDNPLYKQATTTFDNPTFSSLYKDSYSDD